MLTITETSEQNGGKILRYTNVENTLELWVIQDIFKETMSKVTAFCILFSLNIVL